MKGILDTFHFFILWYLLMNKFFQGQEYEIPLALLERFDNLIKKIEFAKKENYKEMYRGYSIVFNCEFEKYMK